MLSENFVSMLNMICSSSKLAKELVTPTTYAANNYIFKVNDRNTRARCEICSKVTIKTPE